MENVFAKQITWILQEMRLQIDNGNASMKGRKRTLAVQASLELDLEDASIPVTKEVVEAMRKRIIELEDALQGQPSAKRAKTLKNVDEAPKAGPSTGSSAGASASKTKVDAKKVDTLLKRFWTSLQKEVKTEKYKFRGGDPKECKIDEIIEVDDFHAIFDGKGVLIQPTPTNKPTSTVTIKEFARDVEDLFGKYFKELKGNRYSVGGIMARFAKGEKIGLVALNINGLSVSYAKNTMKCTLKFEVEEATMYRVGLDDDFAGYGLYKNLQIGF
ncbi:hypothetical protein DFH11DRAFT_1540827 [Phellopilus nigrolimitatus]|nr:hypothetical protein DFH11DRAFT_1540827 [Phellopilus nigrolimitatus]